MSHFNSDNGVWKCVAGGVAVGAAIGAVVTLGLSKRASEEKGLDNPTIGYHLIRGLGAPLRMMCYYKSQNFTNVGYGADMKATWFGDAKPKLKQTNGCINLPYIINGDEVVTQSNTCLVYLGKKLAIDTAANATHNHTVLDQTMDLRNDLMKIVYPFGAVKTKDQFPEAAKKHLDGTTSTHLTKLEAFCKGTFMCGESPQSGDFALFEMLDQHESICLALGESNILDKFPKLKALHAALKTAPALAGYFKSASYKMAQNNGLYTHFTGHGADFVYGPTVEEQVTF